MSRLLLAALAALLLLPVSSALAHQGNANYRSVITAKPQVPGLGLQKVHHDDSLELVNRTDQLVTVEGYDGEPYVRLQPDGTVERNVNSAATYVNDERDGSGTPPPNATPDAAPRWQVLDRTGRYTWHDHRIHDMGAGLPEQVTDRAKPTRVFDWSVPVRVGTSQSAIAGHLDWLGKQDGGVPTGALVGGAVVLLAAAGLVVGVRRRRDPASAGRAPRERAEAW